MLDVQNLRKRYGELVAVDDVSFAVGPGETVGLLGPNGAGKTTTVSMIAGLVDPDAGRVLLDGQPLCGDADPNKRKIGLVPQELALYDELTALENLDLFGALYDLPPARLRDAIAGALDLVGLADRARDPVRAYSGGMKRRLNLAASLLHDPSLIILDEPTVGIDPQSRNAIFENLQALRARGKSILYTTHYMEEAERLCDRVVIVDHGRVVADDALRGLYALVPSAGRLVVDLDDPAEGPWLEAVRAVPGVNAAEVEGHALRVDLDSLTAVAPDVLGRLRDHGRAYGHIASARPDLETVFLTLTGRSLRDS